MLRQASQRTKRFLQEMVKTSPLPELIDYFHAFLAFCVDPSSLLSPLSKFCLDNQQKETKRKENLSYIAECFAFDIEMKFKMHKLPTELQVYFEFRILPHFDIGYSFQLRLCIPATHGGTLVS